jgi:FHS family L-fucose permease-like MFS transporter
MMIMGGAFVSLFQGFLADHVTGIQYSYIAGILCFTYLIYYAIQSKKILKSKELIFRNKELEKVSVMHEEDLLSA